MPKARIIVGFCVLLVSGIGMTQPRSSAVSGIITDHAGAPFPDAPVRAVNIATGTDARTFSDESGRYELGELPAGTYVVSVSPPCCAFEPYVNEGVTLAAGQALELDIELVEGGSLNTLGDDPGTIASEILERQVIPDAPVPRTADGKPDLSGVWLISFDRFPEPARALPWAEAVARERIANNGRDHPHTRCLPSQPPVGGGATPFIAKYVHTPDLLVILLEDTPGYRQVFLDGRGHAENPNPAWLGHAVGRWEGDTLVVESVGFNDRGWIESYPRTEQLRLEERYTRTEYGHMDVRVTYDDPGVFVEPLVRNFEFDLAPQEELIEYVCENNKWAREPGE